MGETLFRKVWNAHAVRTLPSGHTQLFVGLHLIHEVTTPQAFDMLRQQGWGVAFPERTFGTIDHIVPTVVRSRPYLDVMAEEMTASLERNCRDFGVNLWAAESDEQGIVHVIGPELGLTQPGMTIACGDSHTSTHGALGAIAFGRALLWGVHMDLAACVAVTILVVCTWANAVELDELSVKDNDRYESTEHNWRVLKGLGLLIASLAEGLPVAFGAAVTRIVRAEHFGRLVGHFHRLGNRVGRQACCPAHCPNPTPAVRLRFGRCPLPPQPFVH
jgi:hypothetical protein